MIALHYTGPDTPAARKEAVEQELDRFDTVFKGTGNSPLARSERALLRTYLVARLSGRMSSPPADR